MKHSSVPLSICHGLYALDWDQTVNDGYVFVGSEWDQWPKMTVVVMQYSIRETHKIQQ